MEYTSYTLADEPFHFDIAVHFPDEQRRLLESAMSAVTIAGPSDVPTLEEQLNTQLEARGYLWDKRHKEKCTLWRPDFRMSLDFFHEEHKIGIEVEKTEVKRVIHDFLKLINGSMTFVPRIRYGVIIHPKTYKRESGKESEFSGRVFNEVPFYFKRLILNTLLNDVLFLVYEF